MVAVIGILFLIILIIGHELGHFFAAKLFKMRVDELGFGFPPRIFSKKKGETTYSFNLLPFGGFVKIHGEHPGKVELDEPERSFTHQKAYKRAVVIIAGAFMNFIIGWIAISAVFAIGIPTRVVISNVLPGSPADLAGFQVGNVLNNYSSSEEFLNFVNTNKGEEVLINDISVTPRENPPEGEGALGITIIDSGIERQSIVRSVFSGFVSAIETTWLIAIAFIGFISSIFGGNLEVVEQVTGPVGIFGMLGEVSGLGTASLLQFLGLISLNLVVINLIPFPALDGGRFMTIALEKLTGRKLSYKFELTANIVGLALLFLLMVVVTIRDINNIL